MESIDEFIESARKFIRGQGTPAEDNLRLQGVLSALERAEKAPYVGLPVGTEDGVGHILSERAGRFTVTIGGEMWDTDRVEDVDPRSAEAYSQEIVKEALLSRMNRHNGLHITHSALEGVSVLLRYSKSLGQNVLTLPNGNCYVWNFEGNSWKVAESDMEPAVIDVDFSQPYVGSYWPNAADMVGRIGPGSLLVDDMGREIAIRKFNSKVMAFTDDGVNVDGRTIVMLEGGATVKRWYPNEEGV